MSPTPLQEMAERILELRRVVEVAREALLDGAGHHSARCGCKACQAIEAIASTTSEDSSTLIGRAASDLMAAMESIATKDIADGPELQRMARAALANVRRES